MPATSLTAFVTFVSSVVIASLLSSKSLHSDNSINNILPDVPPIPVGLIEHEHHRPLLHLQAVALVSSIPEEPFFPQSDSESLFFQKATLTKPTE